MTSIRRLSDKTLAKYQAIVEAGGKLTPRQQKALEGHALITNRPFMDALLRPDLPVADEFRAALGVEDTQELTPVDTAGKGDEDE